MKITIPSTFSDTTSHHRASAPAVTAGAIAAAAGSAGGSGRSPSRPVSRPVLPTRHGFGGGSGRSPSRPVLPTRHGFGGSPTMANDSGGTTPPVAFTSPTMPNDSGGTNPPVVLTSPTMANDSGGTNPPVVLTSPTMANDSGGTNPPVVLTSPTMANDSGGMNPSVAVTPGSLEAKLAARRSGKSQRAPSLTVATEIGAANLLRRAVAENTVVAAAGQPISETEVAPNTEVVNENDVETFVENAMTAEQPIPETEVVPNNEPVPNDDTIVVETFVENALTAEQPIPETEVVPNNEPVPNDDTIVVETFVENALTAEQPIPETEVVPNTEVVNENDEDDVVMDHVEQPETEVVAEIESATEPVTESEDKTDEVVVDDPAAEAVTELEDKTEPVTESEDKTDEVVVDDPAAEAVTELEDKTDEVVVDDPAAEVVTESEDKTDEVVVDDPAAEVVTESEDKPNERALESETKVDETSNTDGIFPAPGVATASTAEMNLGPKVDETGNKDDHGLKKLEKRFDERDTHLNTAITTLQDVTNNKADSASVELLLEFVEWDGQQTATGFLALAKAIGLEVDTELLQNIQLVADGSTNKEIALVYNELPPDARQGLKTFAVALNQRFGSKVEIKRLVTTLQSIELDDIAQLRRLIEVSEKNEHKSIGDLLQKILLAFDSLAPACRNVRNEGDSPMKQLNDAVQFLAREDGSEMTLVQMLDEMEWIVTPSRDGQRADEEGIQRDYPSACDDIVEWTKHNYESENPRSLLQVFTALKERVDQLEEISQAFTELAETKKVTKTGKIAPRGKTKASTAVELLKGFFGAVETQQEAMKVMDNTMKTVITVARPLMETATAKRVQGKFKSIAPRHLPASQADISDLASVGKLNADGVKANKNAFNNLAEVMKRDDQSQAIMSKLTDVCDIIVKNVQGSEKKRKVDEAFSPTDIVNGLCSLTTAVKELTSAVTKRQKVDGAGNYLTSDDE